MSGLTQKKRRKKAPVADTGIEQSRRGTRSEGSGGLEAMSMPVSDEIMHKKATRARSATVCRARWE